MTYSQEQKKLLKDIGTLCVACRTLRKKTIEDVAKETGFSTRVVKAFERGELNNALLYHWYLGTEFDL